MTLFRDILHQPLALLGAMLLGGWAGVLWPQAGALLAAAAGVYLSLIQAAALPFLMLAVYFGLQHLAPARRQWRLLGALAALGLLAMLLCALGGAVLASVSAAGASMDPGQEAALGRLAMGAERPLEISLHAAPTPASAAAEQALVPRNLFAVMAFGPVPSVLIGVLLFGAAVAVQRHDAASHLNTMLEAVYRGIELTIRSLNVGLPLIAFVLAAAATSAAGGESISLLAGFLGTWFVCVLAVGTLVVALICWRLKAHPWPVMSALRAPVMVCLFTPAGGAALPELIDALSVRLGFGRGVVELLGALFPVFIKTGEALFFAVLAVFIAHLYQRPLGAADIVMVSLLSCWTALSSIGVLGLKSALWAGVLQAWFGLPLDAMLPTLALVEVLCEGARSLVSYLAATALIVIGGDALQSRTAVPLATAAPAAPRQLVVRRAHAWLCLMLMSIALLCVFCAGLGAGLRNTLLTTL